MTQEFSGAHLKEKIIMSLDVNLSIKYLASYDGGKTHVEKEDEVYWANITHNLGRMATEAGIYEAIWRPHRLHSGFDDSCNYVEEISFESSVQMKAKDVSGIIEKGLLDMKQRPDHYKQFDSTNGWGTYKDFIPWVEDYLAACREHPEAEIYTSR